MHIHTLARESRGFTDFPMLLPGAGHVFSAESVGCVEAGHLVRLETSI